MTEGLWQKYLHSGDQEAKEALILEYLPLVKQVAGRLALGLPAHMEEEELAACGVIGLLEALERYRPSRGAGFKTFATWRIRGAMLDELRKNAWMPRSIYQQLRKLQAAEQKMSHTLGREPTRQELAGELGWTPAKVEKVYAQINHCALLSLEELLFSASLFAVESGNFFSSAGPFAQPEEKLETGERRELLAEAIGELRERERLVMSLYYVEELTLREIGEILQVSTARVSQIHAQAILNLREKMQKAGYIQE
ncbi:MAG: FliA/WhiG family RNA polymerase sigma factor [Firmicutes bacterium]|nr:FliA/WhiG family RNA polymerase sigma factor [Bacillota bacterium]